MCLVYAIFLLVYMIFEPLHGVQLRTHLPSLLTLAAHRLVDVLLLALQLVHLLGDGVQLCPQLRLLTV